MSSSPVTISARTPISHRLVVAVTSVIVAVLLTVALVTTLSVRSSGHPTRLLPSIASTDCMVPSSFHSAC